VQAAAPSTPVASPVVADGNIDNFHTSLQHMPVTMGIDHFTVMQGMQAMISRQSTVMQGMQAMIQDILDKLEGKAFEQVKYSKGLVELSKGFKKRVEGDFGKVSGQSMALRIKVTPTTIIFTAAEAMGRAAF